ncbi:MAG: YbaN family protein [Bacteroidota bacterium]
MGLRRIILVILGTLSLGLGLLGIIVPGLPTTPFLLLTAGLYIRSSERLHRWVVSNRYLGKYIREFEEKKGMTRRQKAWSLLLMWTMILSSVIFFIDRDLIRIVVLALGLTGTVVMVFVLKTVDPD